MNGRSGERPSARSATLTCIALLAAALAATGTLVACGDEQPSAPTGDPNITGVVASATAIDGGDALGSFLIDQGSGDYDKASVAVNGDTGWYQRAGDAFKAIDVPTADELAGKTVEVQFTGPVAESYPVQATAGWVIVGD